MSKPRVTKFAVLFASLLCAAPALGACAVSSGSSNATVAAGEPEAHPVVKSGHLTICTTDAPPNIYYDDAGELVGVEMDVAHSMAANLGLEVELLEYSFAGLIPALQAGQCDVIFGSLYIKPEREEIVDFVPYLFSGTAVAVSTDNPHKITGFDDSLCGGTIAAVNGATGASLIAERNDECVTAGEPGIEITLVDEGVLGLQQLRAGQVDAFVDTSSIVGYYSKQSDGDFRAVGEPFGAIQIGAATLKNNNDLHNALSDAFSTALKDGTYEEILEKWGMESEDIRKS